ncbi:MAG: transposase [Planctomycetaceae bacterium]
MDAVFRRRRLPHLDVAGGTYFVTAALAGSRPALGLARNRYRGPRSVARCSVASSAAASPPGWLTDRDAAAERALDLEPLVRWLARDDLATIVQAAILHGAGTRYDLLAYVVMPSHIHLVFTPFEDAANPTCRNERGRAATPRQRILHSIRGYSARACNRLLGRSGEFWQRECHDRWLRGPDEVRRAVEYVAFNPVAAGLCRRPEDWRFSSAWRCQGEP